MAFYLKKEVYEGRPAYRVHETTGGGADRVVDENYYVFILTTSTIAKAIFALRMDEELFYFIFQKSKGKMKEITVSSFDRAMYRKMASEAKEFGKAESRGFGSRGFKRPVRLWHVKGSIQAAKAIEAQRQKVAAGLATTADMEIEIVDQETLSLAQNELTRGQSFVFLPQEEAEPVKDNILLSTPTKINGQTCIKFSEEIVCRGKNPLVQKNENAFSFSGTQLAMSACNAFTHAVESGQENGKAPKNSWEWLHVRGKQMGGDFSPNNLVAGTYHGNSSMIEFENALTAHARYFSANAKAAWTFIVTWTASCEPKSSHVGKWILVEWYVNYSGEDAQEFFDGAEYKIFLRDNNMVFEATRETIWSAEEGANVKRKCLEGV